MGGEKRAAILETAADLFERDMRAADWACACARRARRSPTRCRTCARRSISCAMYAAQARADFAARRCCRTRRASATSCRCTGAASSPASRPGTFPLAIFTGQIAGALAAGNAVIAKPAEQTPLIAAAASRLLHEAGVPGDVLHLLPGDGATIGACADPRPRASTASPSPASTETAQRHQPRARRHATDRSSR